MIPGPDRIVACPSCGALAKHGTLVSGNTFGARTWTDGKQAAPMLPAPPAVVKCHQCAACYWLAEAGEVGSVEPWGDDGADIDPAWREAPSVREPEEEEYYQAILEGLARDPRGERTLRMLAWWRRNDAYRNLTAAPASPAAVLSQACRHNMRALADLLDEGDVADRLMKAELLRELGEFAAATRLLGHVKSARYRSVVRQMSALCQAQDPHVRELHFDE